MKSGVVRERETHFGADVPGFTGQIVANVCACEFSRSVLVELGYFAVVGNCCTVFDCAHDQGDVHP